MTFEFLWLSQKWFLFININEVKQKSAQKLRKISRAELTVNQFGSISILCCWLFCYVSTYSFSTATRSGISNCSEACLSGRSARKGLKLCEGRYPSSIIISNQSGYIKLWATICGSNCIVILSCRKRIKSSTNFKYNIKKCWIKNYSGGRRPNCGFFGKYPNLESATTRHNTSTGSVLHK